MSVEFVVRRLPPLPKHKTMLELRRLSKKALIERCWAATVNSDEAMEIQSEWAARAWELVDMLDGKRPVEPVVLQSIRAHREHVINCKLGSCEHEYAALVRANLVPTADEGGR